MKKIFTLIASVFLLNASFAQWQTKSYTYGGITRQYMIYVPASYSASQAVPLVFTLHGLGDNMANFSQINMNGVADTANFIVVVPQAIVDNVYTNSSCWNSGAGEFGFYPNTNIDDVGFLSSLIDTVSAHYTINPHKVFSCGFSMGGFMSERLACELNIRIAAIASVSGTIGSGITCNPGRAVSVAHFHGTADQTVAYTGNAYGMDAMPTVKFWVNNDHCDTAAIATALPDIMNDGYTIDHFAYKNGDNNTKVEHWRVNGADHVWLIGSVNDIDYASEIWRFFRDKQYVAGIKNSSVQNNTLVYPNPSVNGVLNFSSLNNSAAVVKAEITDMSGRIVSTSENKAGLEKIQLQQQKGMYIITLTFSNGTTQNHKIIAE